jgi:hypothetical protein
LQFLAATKPLQNTLVRKLYVSSLDWSLFQKTENLHKVFAKKRAGLHKPAQFIFFNGYFSASLYFCASELLPITKTTMQMMTAINVYQPGALPPHPVNITPLAPSAKIPDQSPVSYGNPIVFLPFLDQLDAGAEAGMPSG